MEKKNRVLITGMACATSGGLGKSSLRQTLKNRTYTLESDYGKVNDCEIRKVGVINRNSRELDKYYRDNDGIDFSTALLLYLIEEALGDASLPCPLTPGDELNMIVGSTNGFPLDYLGLYEFRQQERKNFDNAAIKEISQLCFREDMYTSRFQKFLGCGVRKMGVGIQCTSSILAILLAVSRVKNEGIPRVLVGGYDFFSPSSYFLLQQAGLLDESLSDPFGVNHRGLNIGDGAAFLVLESEEEVRRRGLTHCCGEISGGALACHPVDGDPSIPGIIKVVKETLENAGIEPGEVDFISPHGTGIPDMDRAESIGLERCFGPRIHEIPMAVYSPFVGYSFAASGLLDIVILLDGMQEGSITAGYRPGKMDAVSDFNLFTGDMDASRVKNILKLKLAFSGSIGGLVLSPFGL